jgi:hypothetical protein
MTWKKEWKALLFGSGQAVIVGAIILAKFTLRWSGLKRLARDLRKR